MTVVDVQIRWVPWEGVGDLGRPYLEAGPEVSAAWLSPPATELPLVARTDRHVLFELPVPRGEVADAPNRERATLRLTLRDGGSATMDLELTRGRPKPHLLSETSAIDTDGGDEILDVRPNESVAEGLRAASFVSAHIEAMNELNFPSRATDRQRPFRAEGLTLIGTERFERIYWMPTDDRGPMALIVRIAEACENALRSICERPRRVLRRERLRERVERVQQLDAACLRWLVRQPGRTIAEKAGPEQRVLGVVRLETTDTLENRVVRDFLKRSLRAGQLYLQENKRYRNTYRYDKVLKFRSRVRRWLRHSEISLVPDLVGAPAPNYVLMMDARYSVIWQWYERLRRQQLEQDAAWRWQHRMWAEHVTLRIARVLGHLGSTMPGYAGRHLIRLDPDRGQFLNERSPLGPYLLGSSDDPTVVDVVRPSRYDRVRASHDNLEKCLQLGPDCVLLVRRRLTEPIQKSGVIGVWSSLGVWTSPLSEPGERYRVGHLESAGAITQVRALVVIANSTPDPFPDSAAGPVVPIDPSDWSDFETLEQTILALVKDCRP